MLRLVKRTLFPKNEKRLPTTYNADADKKNVFIWKFEAFGEIVI